MTTSHTPETKAPHDFAAQRFGLLIIGDELLCGRRQDRHMGFFIDTLQRRGLELAWVSILGDEIERLAAVLQTSLAAPNPVFCLGGIGATPDDCTRQAAARACGSELVRHPEAVALLEARFGEAAYPWRIRMAELPAQARLIPNPVNQIPGFSLGEHHFLPGFPNMAWPMSEWVLDHYYAAWRGAAVETRTVQVWHVPESELIPIMDAILAAYPGVQVSSLPSTAADQPRVELGLRGQREAVAPAYAAMLEALQARGYDYEAW